MVSEMMVRLPDPTSPLLFLTFSDTDLLLSFTACIEFKGDSFVAGLRKFLSKFMLPGEAQKISRVMEVFAAEFLKQNPGVFPHEDVGFVLAFALIMLNTDAHNPAIADKDKMTKEQFVWFVLPFASFLTSGQEQPRHLGRRC